MNPTNLIAPGMIASVIIVLGFLAALVLSVYYITKARNRERLALIEKGYDVSDIYKPKDYKKIMQKFGVILVFLALGVMVSYLFWALIGGFETTFVYAIVILFTGIGLLVANYIKFNKNS